VICKPSSPSSSFVPSRQHPHSTSTQRRQCSPNHQQCPRARTPPQRHHRQGSKRSTRGKMQNYFRRSIDVHKRGKRESPILPPLPGTGPNESLRDAQMIPRLPMLLPMPAPPGTGGNTSALAGGSGEPPRALTMREAQLVDHLVRLQLVSFPLCLSCSQKEDFVLILLRVVLGYCSGVVAAARNDPQRNCTSSTLPPSRLHKARTLTFSIPDRKCTQCTTPGQHSQALNQPTQSPLSHPPTQL
jgi:hypothetical protein